jgi:hypothetical protein
MGTFRKSSQESNLNHESSSLLIRRLKTNTDFSPTTIHTQEGNRNRQTAEIETNHLKHLREGPARELTQGE